VATGLELGVSATHSQNLSGAKEENDGGRSPSESSSSKALKVGTSDRARGDCDGRKIRKSFSYRRREKKRRMGIFFQENYQFEKPLVEPSSGGSVSMTFGCVV